MNISPPNLKFHLADKPKYELAGQGNQNHELIYGGTDGDSFKINYREYTDKNLARAPFFQNLVYPANSKEFRFKDYVIAVHEVDSGKIVYSVTTDGL
jgi:hypothetical protein